MSKIGDCNEGIHEMEWEKPRKTTGSNLFGQIVTCWGSDGSCKHCGSASWKRVEKGGKHDKKN